MEARSGGGRELLLRVRGLNVTVYPDSGPGPVPQPLRSVYERCFGGEPADRSADPSSAPREVAPSRARERKRGKDRERAQRGKQALADHPFSRGRRQQQDDQEDPDSAVARRRKKEVLRRGLRLEEEAEDPVSRISPEQLQQKAGPTRLLHDVNLDLEPGRFVALMGQSGSGKSTLLECLSGRMQLGSKGSRLQVQTSQLQVRGVPVEPADLHAHCCYSAQDPPLISELTVLETVQFSALFGLDEAIDEEDKLELCEEVLAQLQLSHCAHTLIGNSFLKGVSGGERKRATIAMELVLNASTLFFDEPTSGLDSATSFTVMNTLRQVCHSRFGRRGQPARSVVCVIHQPSQEVWDLLDDVWLMKSGHLIFQGSKEEALEHMFAVIPLPRFTEPAEHLLDVIRDIDLKLSLRLRAERQKRVAKALRKAALAQKSARKNSKRSRSRAPDDHLLQHQQQQQQQRRPSSRQQLLQVGGSDEEEPGSASDIRIGMAGFGNRAALGSYDGGPPLREEFKERGHRRGQSSLDLEDPYLAQKQSGGAGSGAGYAQQQQRGKQGKHRSSSRPRREVSRSRERRSSSRRRSRSAKGSAIIPVRPGSRSSSRQQNQGSQAASSSSSSWMPNIFRRSGGNNEQANPRNGVVGKPEHATSFKKQVKLLLRRNYILQKRSRMLWLFQFTQVVMLAVLICLSYAPLDSNQTSIINRLGIIYFMLMGQVFGSSLSVVLTFADERAVYLREQYSSAYRPLAYFAAKSIFSFPVAAISCLLFSALVYPICGFQSGFDRFMRFTVTLSLCSFVGQGAGLLVGACVSSKAKAAILSPLSLAPIVLFTKYAIPVVPGWLRWLQIVSPFWWAYDTLALDELGGVPLHCSKGEDFMVPWYSHGTVAAKTLCRFPNGSEVLEYYGLPHDPSEIVPMWFTNAFMLILIAMFFRVIAFVILKWRT